MTDFIRPCDRIVQVGFQVDDWPLPASIRQIRVIPSINYIKHHRPRTEIEWRAIPDVQAGMTGELQAEPPPLYVIHPDGSTHDVSLYGNAVTPKITVSDDGRQSVYVRDVIDFRLRRRGHGEPMIPQQWPPCHWDNVSRCTASRGYIKQGLIRQPAPERESGAGCAAAALRLSAVPYGTSMARVISGWR